MTPGVHSVSRLASKIIFGILPFMLSAAGCQADLDAKIGQMIMVGFRGMTISPDDQIAKDIRLLNLGGVILFDKDVALGGAPRNIRDAEQVKKLVEQLQSQAAIPLFVGIDVEGGRVNRLKEQYGFPPTVSAAELGMRQSRETSRAAAKIGTTLYDLGINLDFAPVLDVNVNPDNPVIGKLGRSFSADPEITGRCGSAFIYALRTAGVFSCAKHFPGHGSSTTDSHLGLPDVSDTWSAKELVPYQSVMQSRHSTPDMIMIGHLFNKNWDDKYPATLSEKVVRGMLRDQLGFDGVVITDDMQMKAITDQFGLEQAVLLAVNAGADILLFGNNLSYDPQLALKVRAMLKRMVLEGKIHPRRIDESFSRIMALKKKLGGPAAKN